MSTSDSHERGSADKGRKRQRDRDNQRRKRLKEKEVLLSLQNENTSLKQQVRLLSEGSTSSEDTRHLSNMLAEITAQNEALRKQVASVNEFVTSWTSLDRDGCQRKDSKNTQKSTSYAGTNTLNGGRPTDTYAAPTNDYNDTVLPITELNVRRTLSITFRNAPKQSTQNKTKTGQPSLDVHPIPEWQRLPALSSDYEGCGRPFDFAIQLLQSQPEFAKFCTPYPKIIDLMLGGSLNELANAIFRITAQSTIRRPERIAINWNGYLFIRWTIEPSPESYSRLPPALRPTSIQLQVPHPGTIDHIMWPQVRNNFIRLGTKFWRDEVFGLLFCTCRIRDTPGTDFSSIDSGDNAFQIDLSFLERASNAEDWVLLKRFWDEYPELVEGLDAKTYMITDNELF